MPYPRPCQGVMWANSDNTGVLVLTSVPAGLSLFPRPRQRFACRKGADLGLGIAVQVNAFYHY